MSINVTQEPERVAKWMCLACFCPSSKPLSGCKCMMDLYTSSLITTTWNGRCYSKGKWTSPYNMIQKCHQVKHAKYSSKTKSLVLYYLYISDHAVDQATYSRMRSHNICNLFKFFFREYLSSRVVRCVYNYCPCPFRHCPAPKGEKQQFGPILFYSISVLPAGKQLHW